MRNIYFIHEKTKTNDPNGEIYQKKKALVSDITQAIDELSNLKTLKQLEQETLRAKETSLELEKKAKVQEYRLEQAQLRMKKIEDEEKERCY